jgi:hypothetical protein
MHRLNHPAALSDPKRFKTFGNTGRGVKRTLL